MADQLPPEAMPLVVAIRDALADSYRRGREDGLAVAEKIAAWLTRQPDTPEQAEVRQWANAAIQRERLR